MKFFSFVLTGLLVCSLANAGSLVVPNYFTADTPALAEEVNANFAEVAAQVNDNDQRISSIASNTPPTSLSYYLVDDNGVDVGKIFAFISSKLVLVGVDYTDALNNNHYVFPFTFNKLGLTNPSSSLMFISADCSGQSYMWSHVDSPEAFTNIFDLYILLKDGSDYDLYNRSGADVSVTINSYYSDGYCGTTNYTDMAFPIDMVANNIYATYPPPYTIVQK